MSARNDNLESLYDALVEALAKSIKNGTATASHLNVARQLLESAGINADADHPDELTRGLRDALTEYDEATTH